MEPENLSACLFSMIDLSILVYARETGKRKRERERKEREERERKKRERERETARESLPLYQYETKPIFPTVSVMPGKVRSPKH